MRFAQAADLLLCRRLGFFARARKEGYMQLNSIELKGKPLSLGAKILGVFIAVGALVMKATVSPTLDIDAAIKVAAFVVLVFAPIVVSMWMRNIFTPLANARTNYPQAYTVPQAYTAMETGGGK
jgi:predicted phage tail protein